MWLPYVLGTRRIRTKGNSLHARMKRRMGRQLMPTNKRAEIHPPGTWRSLETSSVVRPADLKPWRRVPSWPYNLLSYSTGISSPADAAHSPESLARPLSPTSLPIWLSFACASPVFAEPRQPHDAAIICDSRARNAVHGGLWSAEGSLCQLQASNR